MKSHKESQNSRNRGFSYYFCLVMPKNIRMDQQHCQNYTEIRIYSPKEETLNSVYLEKGKKAVNNFDVCPGQDYRISVKVECFEFARTYIFFLLMLQRETHCLFLFSE
jgi:hypothetical protein